MFLHALFMQFSPARRVWAGSCFSCRPMNPWTWIGRFFCDTARSPLFD